MTFADERRYTSDEEPVEGTVYREYGGVGPVSSEGEWVVTAFEPPARQVHVGDPDTTRPGLTMSLMRPGLPTALAERDGGTRFTRTLGFEAFPRLRPMGWLLERLSIGRPMRAGPPGVAGEPRAAGRGRRVAAAVTGRGPAARRDGRCRPTAPRLTGVGRAAKAVVDLVDSRASRALRSAGPRRG